MPTPPQQSIIDLQRQRMVVYNQWYPVGLSGDVVDEPLEFEFLD